MEYKTLANGVKMPVIGFGVYQVEDYAQCEQSVLNALDSGYRRIELLSGKTDRPLYECGNQTYDKSDRMSSVFPARYRP